MDGLEHICGPGQSGGRARGELVVDEALAPWLTGPEGIITVGH